MISRRRKLANWVIRLANIIQTIPSLAMISILIIGLGLGVNVVIVTVFLYSLTDHQEYVYRDDPSRQKHP